MMTLLTIAVFAVIVALAWGGMRLMQRATGCTCEMPEQSTDTP